MKFLAILCLLAFTAADEDKTQDKKTQPFDAIQNASSLTQPANTLLNGQGFPPTSFASVFTPSDPITNLAYSGFNGNVSPIQTVNADFFANQQAGGIPVNPTIPVNGAVPINTAIPVSGGIPLNVNGAIPGFPVATRTVLPGTNAVVNGIQSPFPVPGNVFPAVAAIPTTVSGIPSQFPGAGILPVSAVPTGTIDANTATNGVISAAPAFRFLTPDTLTGIGAQGLQPAQQVGLAAIPAFTSGILPSLTNGVLQSQLQNQNIPAGIQQVLKGPTGNPTGIPTGIPNGQGLTGGNISTGPLTTVFRHA